jgi:hypothetical protein
LKDQDFFLFFMTRPQPKRTARARRAKKIRKEVPEVKIQNRKELLSNVRVITKREAITIIRPERRLKPGSSIKGIALWTKLRVTTIEIMGRK